MPGEVIDQPNPPPLPSHLPETILDLAVKIDKTSLDENVAESLKDFQQAACYIAGGMPFIVWRDEAPLILISYDLSTGQRVD